MDSSRWAIAPLLLTAAVAPIGWWLPMMWPDPPEWVAWGLFAVSCVSFIAFLVVVLPSWRWMMKLIVTVDCENAYADKMSVENVRGAANIMVLIKGADFRNHDTSHSQVIKSVTLVIEIPDGNPFELHQSAFPPYYPNSLEDYKFGPGEIRSREIMGFQTRPQKRLGYDGFLSLYGRRSEWRCYLVIRPGIGRMQRLPVSIAADAFPVPSVLTK